MSASLSPEHESLSHTSADEDDRSALGTFNKDFIKSLSDKRNKGDGEEPKRRGPKPNSKPAMTRRQELNRQAQRSHRERKEHYIKALETEVLRLKEIFTSVSQQKNTASEENKQLRDLLTRNGITLPDELRHNSPSANSPSYHTAGSPSNHSQFAGSQGVVSPVASLSAAPVKSPAQVHTQGAYGRGIDYEQAGIDFVLTLERPCMNHLPFLVDRASEPGGEPCGHAMMASCPPQPFADIAPGAAFGQALAYSSGEAGQQTWKLTKTGLATLLDLSLRLDLDGEITPVMAWNMILRHPKLQHLEPADFMSLAEDMANKMRCYGFGAVAEEFEVRDAIEAVVARRSEEDMPMVGS